MHNGADAAALMDLMSIISATIDDAARLANLPMEEYAVSIQNQVALKVVQEC